MGLSLSTCEMSPANTKANTLESTKPPGSCQPHRDAIPKSHSGPEFGTYIKIAHVGGSEVETGPADKGDSLSEVVVA